MTNQMLKASIIPVVDWRIDGHGVDEHTIARRSDSEGVARPIVAVARIDHRQRLSKGR